MNVDVPYLQSVKNLSNILDKIQKAGVPTSFNHEFLRDLGFTSSVDRGIIRLLKYLGFLDGSGKPQSSYRDFMDHTKSKSVLAERLRAAFDDLFLSSKDANAKSAQELKGWFKSKTGQGEAVSEKIATTFKALASYADFTALAPASTSAALREVTEAPTTVALPESPKSAEQPPPPGRVAGNGVSVGLTYRIEVHLPDTTNLETYRAIFRALREELVK